MNLESDKFDSTVRKVLSLSREEMLKREQDRERATVRSGERRTLALLIKRIVLFSTADCDI